MKWMILGLFAALVLIALGLWVSGSPGKKAISSNPEARALCEEGTADLYAFRLESAVTKLGLSLELDPSLAEASIARTLALARLFRRSEAELELARAESLTSQIQDDQRRMLAQLQLATKLENSKFRQMRDSILVSLEKDIPDHLTVLEAHAYQSSYALDDDVMEDAWKKILEVNPNYANSYNMLGYLELYRQNFDQAIDYMQKYAYLAPGLANPHDSLGDVYMAQGRYEEAEAEYRLAVTITPDFYYSLINLGRSYLARGQLKTGLKIMEQIRAQVAGSGLEERIDNAAVVAYHDAGLLEEMDKVMVASIVRFPESGTACFYRALRLAKAGRQKEGKAVLDSCLAEWRAETLYKTNENHQKRIDRIEQLYDARVADLNGDHAAAVRLWSNVLALNPTDRFPHEMVPDKENLAAALLANGQPTEALAVVEPLLAINPRLLKSLLIATESCLDLQNAERARLFSEQLNKALSFADPDFPLRSRARELADRLAVLQ